MEKQEKFKFHIGERTTFTIENVSKPTFMTTQEFIDFSKKELEKGNIPISYFSPDKGKLIFENGSFDMERVCEAHENGDVVIYYKTIKSNKKNNYHSTKLENISFGVFPFKSTIESINNSYELFVCNKSDEIKKVVLFSSDLKFDENFWIKSTDKSKNYSNILKEISENDSTNSKYPFIKVQSQNLKNLDQEFIMSKILNSKNEKKSFKVYDYHSSTERINEVLVFVDKEYENIDSTYRLEFEILPHNSMCFTFFKSLKISELT